MFDSKHFIAFTAALLLSSCHCQFTFDNASFYSHLLWFGTDEGVSTQLRHVEAVWSAAMLFNLTTVLVPFSNNVHYPDLSLPLSMCDIFVLPSNIKCLSAVNQNRTELMLQHSCRFYGPTMVERKGDPLIFNSSHYDLTVLPSMEIAPADFTTLNCVVGSSDYFAMIEPAQMAALKATADYRTRYLDSLKVLQQHSASDLASEVWHHKTQRLKKCARPSSCRQEAEKIPAMIQPYYAAMARDVLKNIGYDRSNSSHDPLMAVHWRRGDQWTRCERHIDKGINCGNVDQFIDFVHSEQKKHSLYKDAIVYISTNDNSTSDLSKLQSQGFKIFSDLNSNQSVSNNRTAAHSFNSLDKIMIDLYIMSTAEKFVHSGVSNILHLVKRIKQTASRL